MWENADFKFNQHEFTQQIVSCLIRDLQVEKLKKVNRQFISDVNFKTK